MSEYISRFWKSSIFSSIALGLLGALLIFQSEITIVSISYVIGGILVAIGVMAILKFVNNVKNDVKNELDLVYGIVTVILGIIVISNPKAIASIIPFVIGVLMIVNSAAKLQYSLELKKNDNTIWTSTLIMSIATLLCGILLVFNPFKGAEIITKIVGILIFVYAILDLITTIIVHRTYKKIHNQIEEKTTEANVVEEVKLDDEDKKKGK